MLWTSMMTLSKFLLLVGMYGGTKRLRPTTRERTLAVGLCVYYF